MLKIKDEKINSPMEFVLCSKKHGLYFNSEFCLHFFEDDFMTLNETAYGWFWMFEGRKTSNPVYSECFDETRELAEKGRTEALQSWFETGSLKS